MSLQDKLDEITAGVEQQGPAEIMAAIAKATQDLIASGQAERALRAGDRAPEFSLSDQDGRAVSSVALLVRGPLVLSFYRGTWCPYCNAELQAIEAVADDIRNRGASIAAISQQTTVNSRRSHRENNLSFPVLSDRGGKIAAEFGVRWHVPESLRPIHKAVGADLALFHGDDSWTLPIPARYVIASDGIIEYSEVNLDCAHRPEPSDVFPILDRLARR